MAGGEGSAHKIKIAERRYMALALRKKGGTYRQIADQLRKFPGVSQKYSVQNAHLDVITTLRELVAAKNEMADEYLRLQLEQLQELTAAWYQKATKGEPLATRMVLDIMDRIARLVGIYAPARVENTGKDGGPIEQKVSGVVVHLPDNGRGDLLHAPNDHGPAERAADSGTGVPG